jgi:hypothetical protein
MRGKLAAAAIQLLDRLSSLRTSLKMPRVISRYSNSLKRSTMYCRRSYLRLFELFIRWRAGVNKPHREGRTQGRVGLAGEGFLE